MGLVPAKCPNCGAGIKVDPDGKAAICEYCGTPFIVEESIKNYYVTQNITQNVTVIKEGSEFEQLLSKFKQTTNRFEKYCAWASLKHSYDGKYQVYECEADLYASVMLGNWWGTKTDETSKYGTMDIIKWEAEDFDELIMKPINKAYDHADNAEEKARIKRKIEELENRCKTAKDYLEKIDKEDDKIFEDIVNNPQKLDNFVRIVHQDASVFTNSEERYCFYQGKVYQISARNQLIVIPSRENFGRKYIVKTNKSEFTLNTSNPYTAPKAYGLVSKYLDGRIILDGFISPEPGKDDKPKFMYSDKYFTYCLNTYEQYLRIKENLCPICGSPIKPGGWISDPKCKKCKKTLFEMFDKKEAVYYIK